MTVKDKLINRVVILDGTHLKDIALTTGQNNVVSHGLGREFQGAKVTLQNANANVWFDQSANTNKTVQLHVQCSANVTVSLWIF